MEFAVISKIKLFFALIYAIAFWSPKLKEICILYYILNIKLQSPETHLDKGRWSSKKWKYDLIWTARYQVCMRFLSFVFYKRVYQAHAIKYALLYVGGEKKIHWEVWFVQNNLEKNMCIPDISDKTVLTQLEVMQLFSCRGLLNIAPPPKKKPLNFQLLPLTSNVWNRYILPILKSLHKTSPCCRYPPLGVTSRD